MYKTGHAFNYLLFKESVANDVINVSLFAQRLCIFGLYSAIQTLLLLRRNYVKNLKY